MKLYFKIPCKPHGDMFKFLLVMKLILVLLATTILQASATSYAQRITLNQKNANLSNIFKEIRKQSNYDFLYDKTVIQNAKPVDIQLKNATIEEALQACFDGQPLTYTIENKIVVVKEKPTFISDIKNILLPPPPIIIKGHITSKYKLEPIFGVTIRVEGTNRGTISDESGNFTLQINQEDKVLIFTCIGKKKQFININNRLEINIQMEDDISALQEVQVVSTGYQIVAKERATGSFEKIDNNLFNRTTGTTIFSRLDGVTAGLLFDKHASSTPGLESLTIRGLSTLNANKTPLVVLDNFPYEGDVNNINPNDVESITILKDAAAASIWGVRAGNGVIVITTKKGSYDKPLQVSFNANLTVANKPDLFYIPQMKSSDYIDVEKYLFSKGNYDASLSDTYSWPLLSPVVEILAKTQGPGATLTQAQADAQINALRNYDVRNDYLKYVYRKAINQQYAFNFSGGSNILSYFASAGYDKDLGDRVNIQNDRITLKSNFVFKPIRNLDIELGTIFTQTNYQLPVGSSALNYSPTDIPYTRLADNNGNPLVVGKDYSTVLTQNPGDSRLLDWTYKPLAELYTNKGTIKGYDLLLNLGAKYTISKVFNVDVKYQYGKIMSDQENVYSQNSYDMRNLINMFTQSVGSQVIRPIPLGGMLDISNSNTTTNSLRGQLNANKTWGTKHQLAAIAGVEVRENNSLSNTNRTYGYNSDLLTYQNVDFTSSYTSPLLPGLGYMGIPNTMDLENIINRYTSIYSNAAYTYNSRYTLSVSARKDASNLFGVKSNLKGVPLWSTGGSWYISQEPFYKLDILPYLKLRVTYGYNGNASNNLSALSIIKYGNLAPYTNLTTASIQNPANDELRWEKVGIMNLGLDFGFKNNRLSGSIEFYDKNAKDLLGATPIGLSTGFTYSTVNCANMEGKGTDLTLHSRNLTGTIKWNTDFILSYYKNKVTHYTPVNIPSASNYLIAGYAITPIEGQPVYAIFSYKWAGLDPATGAPMGYLNGKVSEDYNALTNVSVSDLQFHGSAVPLYYGSLRNTFSWKNISLSANIVYKFDYYFRRTGINYTNLFGNNAIGNADYAIRWQKPGDEKITNVPAMIYPANGVQDNFYTYSSALISKGDHIRLQDITVSYELDKPSRYFKNIKIYGNVSNIGIIWRANKQGIDPDYISGYPTPLTLALGLSANF